MVGIVLTAVVGCSPTPPSSVPHVPNEMVYDHAASESGQSKHGRPLEQGQTIYTEDGTTCSLTIVGKNIGITAKHCVSVGAGEKVYGGPGPGAEIGTVSHLDVAHDIAVIDLDSESWTVHPAEVRTAAPLVGEELVMVTEQSGTQPMRYVSMPSFGKLDTTLASAVPCRTRPGDSGGPILDTDSRVVGIVYGCTRMTTRFTPIPEGLL